MARFYNYIYSHQTLATFLTLVYSILQIRGNRWAVEREVCSRQRLLARGGAGRVAGLRADMQVTIKHWHAVANWTWTTEDDVCGICHMPLDGCAPGAAGPGDDSPVVWGRVRIHV